MIKSNYTFEVHVYAPELNKVYLNGLNVTKYFEKIKKDLTKDFASNIRLIRKTLNYKMYNHYCVGYNIYQEKNDNLMAENYDLYIMSQVDETEIIDYYLTEETK